MTAASQALVSPAKAPMSGARSGMLDRWLDWSLLGYTRLGMSWRGLDRTDSSLRNRVCVVTGATSGIGLASCVGLARAGALVIMVGRDMGKLERCRSQVESLTGSSQVFVECADLSCLEQTRALAERIHARNWPLHRLINNAGVLLPKREATASGLERSTVINLVSHYLLTELLLPRLRATESSGVINVSSGGMYTQRLDLNMLKGHGGYDGVVSYAQTKRAQVILTERWADNPLNDKVWFGCMHPGWVDTPGVAFSLPTFYTLTKPLLRSPDQGADTIVWLSSAIESGLPNGRFWHDRKVRPTHRRKATVEQATDRDELVRWLDSLTEKFPTPPLTDAPVSFPCAESGQGR